MKNFICIVSFISLAACSTLSTGIKSNYSKEEITRACKKAIAETKSRIDQLKATPAEKRTFQNTLVEFDRITTDFSDVTSPLIFMASVSLDEKIRAEASACEAEAGAFSATIGTDHDLYLVLRDGKPKASANSTDVRLAEWILMSFEKNGMNLPAGQLAKVTELMQKLSILQSKFAENINNDKTTIKIGKNETQGIPADYLASLKFNEAEQAYVVPTRRDSAEKILQNAYSLDVRKRFTVAYQNVAAPANTQVLEEALLVRQELAHLLGYKTWADYRIENGTMAKKTKITSDFLNSLKKKLAKSNLKVMSRILAAKKKEHPQAKTVDAWDPGYYIYQMKKKDFKIDEEEISEYFPALTVLNGIFEIYATLFNVRFEEVKDAKVWAEGVKLYQVVDSSTQKVRAYFYTDLYSRPGKYGHFAAFPIISGRLLSANTYSKPIASIVGNFPSPTATKPSLLEHDMVETLFHEFGHIMHMTLTTAPYGTLSGASVMNDFVEAPSQMLENWAWNKSILEKISGHYLNPSKKIPAELADRKISFKLLDAGFAYTRQLTFGFFDLDIHTRSGKVNVTAAMDHAVRSIQKMEPAPGNQRPASFGHMMGGYDAGYYGYLWSQVYAEDMFTRFEKEGLLNPTVGLQYRDLVISQGNTKDPMELLKAFLRRTPNMNAFYKSLGI